MNLVLSKPPAPLSRVLGLFSVLLISAALLPGLQAQQAITAGYHVMSKDAEGNISCRMMSPAAAADLGLIFNHQTRSPQPQAVSPQQGGGGDITVTYNGFTSEAQTAFQFAVDIWAALLEINTEIRVDASFTPLGENVLGSAGGQFAGLTIGSDNFAVIFSLADQLVGSDIFPQFVDITANFNSDFDFYFGTDGQPGSQFDFVTLVLHELAHGLGFVDSFSVDGMDGSFGLDQW